MNNPNYTPGFLDNTINSTFKPQQYQTTDFDISNAINHPKNEVRTGTRMFVLDSRQRNCNIYPSPSKYRMPIPQVFKNVTSIELAGCIIPKSSYNVHTTNNKIDFSIGDTVTEIRIINQGTKYTSAPNITITNPDSGTTATATSTISASGTVNSITIVIPGTGYRRSNPPNVYIDPPGGTGIKATAIATVGTLYTATLRPANYTIGSNPIPGTTVLPTDLLLEIQNSMNYAVNGGAYDPVSTGPFVARLVSQYPLLTATPGTPDAFDTNGCKFNRVQITNTNSDHWELLWCSGPNKSSNLRRTIGFPWNDISEPIATPLVDPGGGPIIPAGTTIKGFFDYDLLDYPEYIILNFWASSEEKFERILSVPGHGLNRAFATLIYDANTPNNLLDITGNTTSTVGGVEYLEGALSKGTFYRAPGNVKPLKGYDFDKKYLEFNPPIAKLSNLNIDFTKFGVQAGGAPNPYNFQGDDHLLIFKISSNNTRTGKRWS